MIVINENTRQTAESDPCFASFIKGIEVGVAEASRLIDTKMSFKLEYKRDWQYPEWMKLKLIVKLPEIDFNLKMRIWDQLDDIIRSKIRLQIANEHEFSELDKNFFISVEL